MTDEDVKRAVKSYANGATIRALADLNGVSYGTMYARLQAAGVTFRPRGSRGAVTVFPTKTKLRSVK